MIVGKPLRTANGRLLPTWSAGGTPTPTPGNDPDTDAYLAAMTVQPDAARIALINNLIVGLKSDGVWALLDMLQLYASHDAQAGRVDARAPSRVAVAANSPTFTTDRGYAGDGTTSYVDTGWTPSSGPIYAQNSAMIGSWLNAGLDTGGNSAASLGASTASPATLLVPRDAGNLVRGRVNQTGTTASTAVSATRFGYTALDRSAAAVTTAYKAGVAGGTFATASSASPVNINLYVGGVNSVGSLASAVNNRTAAAWGGGTLNGTQHAALYSRLNTFLTAIGAQ